VPQLTSPPAATEQRGAAVPAREFSIAIAEIGGNSRSSRKQIQIGYVLLTPSNNDSVCRKAGSLLVVSPDEIENGSLYRFVGRDADGLDKS